MRNSIAILIVVVALATTTACSPTPASNPTVEVILTGLENPRGLAVGPAGNLYVAEAGTGYDAVDPTLMTGKLTEFHDHSGDGDYDDEGEVIPWFRHFPTYNAQHFTDSVRDEVGGPSDLLLHSDGRLFLAVDGGFDRQSLFEISPEGAGRTHIGRPWKHEWDRL